MNKEQKEFDQAMDAYYEQLENMHRENEQLLKKHCIDLESEKYYDLFDGAEIGVIKEAQKPLGDPDPDIKGVWVDQWQNGGYTGDSYAGDIYIKINKSLYLKIPYEM